MVWLGREWLVLDEGSGISRFGVELQWPPWLAQWSRGEWWRHLLGVAAPLLALYCLVLCFFGN